MYIKCLPVGPLETNCYLLADETTKRAAVVDPGGSAAAILAAVEAGDWQVERILLTHGHFDHTGAVAALRGALPGVRVFLHAADAALLGRARPFPALAGTEPYGEGDVFSVGALTVEVLHTPGHTPGGVTLRCGEALFTGDTLFAGTCGRTDLPGGSGEDMLASLKRLGELEGDLTVLPGHGEGSTLERERQVNPYLLKVMEK